jgi:hypothetical protein
MIKDTRGDEHINNISTQRYQANIIFPLKDQHITHDGLSLPHQAPHNEPVAEQKHHVKPITAALINPDKPIVLSPVALVTVMWW